MPIKLSYLLTTAATLNLAAANNNGLAITPPQGWRSWNLYGNNVNQSLLQHIMLGMTSKARNVNGKPTSLCDLGYCDVGLDDNWQDCGATQAAPGMHYHDAHATP
jgi:alpha-galactosidase